MSAAQRVYKVPGTNLKVWEVVLTVATGATTETVTSDDYFSGKVKKIEYDPTTVAENATLKGYEANTPLATGTRDHFLDYTEDAAIAELVFYPKRACTDITGRTAILAYTGVDTEDPDVIIPVYDDVRVCDQLRIDLASAVAANSLKVRVYVEG